MINDLKYFFWDFCLMYVLFLVHNLSFQIIFDLNYDWFYIQAALLFI